MQPESVAQILQLHADLKPAGSRSVSGAATDAGYRFGGFLLQPSERRLLTDGEPVALGPRAFDVLVVLVERAGRLVSKEELLERVWPKLVVEEANLQVQISTLRKLIGAEAIATVTGKGYRFTLEVEQVTPDASSSPHHRRHNLPQQVTSFIGRDRETAELKQLLAKTRLLTLVGAGGVGKTRQALQVAAEVASDYADGVWFIDLAPLVDAELVPATVASVLGIDLGNAKVPVEALVRRLKNVELLLLLDNCEHVVATAAAVAEALLAGTINVRVLATSREPLVVAGEQVFHLPSLALPQEHSLPAEEALAAAAVELFVQRAKAADAQFVLDDRNVNSVAAICRRLDGIPLAIEMAAARAWTLGIKELGQKLDERFRLLTSGRRTAVPRHKTLRATLDWSYELLPEQERIVLRRLAIFRGGFTLEAASAVASDEVIDKFAVVDLLTQLVSCSLVVANQTAAGTRYRLLETTRAYALEKLTEAGEPDLLARRHAEYFRERFEHAPDDWLRMHDMDWDAIYLPERDNVRDALDWALNAGNDPELGIALAGCSARMWAELSCFQEGRQRLEAAVARISTDTLAVVEARAWHSLAELTQLMLPQRAVTAMERAVDLYRPLGDTSKLGVGLLFLGIMLAMVDRFQQAALMLAEAFPLLECAGSSKAIAIHSRVSGFVKIRTGDFAGGQAQLQNALSLLRAAGAERGVLVTLSQLAEARWALGNIDAAIASYRELAAQTSGASRNLDWFASSVIAIAGLLTERGELDEALTVAREGFQLLNGTGESWTQMDHLALRAGLAGKLTNAARVAGYTDFNYTARKLQRGPIEARARDRLQALLSEQLAANDFASFLAEGSRMSEDEACRIALED